MSILEVFGIAAFGAWVTFLLYVCARLVFKRLGS